MKCLSHFRVLKEVPVTTWPVITEVSHMLDFHINAQTDFLLWIERGGLEVKNLEDTDIHDIRNRMLKYADTPMELADATLVILSEKLKTNRILSIDSDFMVFRDRFGEGLVNELG